ncbi:MAG: radical SAM protein [Actinomycetota bacterium]
MKIKEIFCKSILNKTGISVGDYALNPYTGCEHDCIYCYAIFMKRFSGHKEPWGNFVDIKINAAGVLHKQLNRLKPGTILLGTVTDPYQPLEEKYEITRSCLKELINFNFPVSIQTKSSLVLRDIDIIKNIKDIEVGYTITILDEKIRKIFEPKSSTTENRFRALSELSNQNINTFLFFGPVIPYFSDKEDVINEIFKEAVKAKVGNILIDSLNPYPKVWGKVKRLIEKKFPEVLDYYKFFYYERNLYKQELLTKIKRIAKNYKIPYQLCF